MQDLSVEWDSLFLNQQGTMICEFVMNMEMIHAKSTKPEAFKEFYQNFIKFHIGLFYGSIMSHALFK